MGLPIVFLGQYSATPRCPFSVINTQYWPAFSLLTASRYSFMYAWARRSSECWEFVEKGTKSDGTWEGLSMMTENREDHSGEDKSAFSGPIEYQGPPDFLYSIFSTNSWQNSGRAPYNVVVNCPSICGQGFPLTLSTPRRNSRVSQTTATLNSFRI